ncbi:hypothetical protein Ancab_029144 [Ancistrocladus abbreviatus]
MGGGNQGERVPSPTNSQRTVSDDDEIDYSIRPEFYDSELDDKDELWVSSKRKGQYSDAVLSCPACFTILCYESQRHETYVTQYRAVFVVNCKVKNMQVLPQGRQKRKRCEKERHSVPVEGSSHKGETVRQVCCDVCSTEVGVIDEEEVYHFYDVIPSEC